MAVFFKWFARQADQPRIWLELASEKLAVV